MDPSPVPHIRPAVSLTKLAIWAVALAFGAYLGNGIADGLAQTGLGLGVLGAWFGAAIAISILAILVVIAAILALAPDKSGHRLARTIFVTCGVFVAGLGVGWAIAPHFEPEYRQSVAFEAPGTMNLSLEGFDGYAGQGDAVATCHSELDAPGVAQIEATIAGRIETAVVGVSVLPVSGLPDGRPMVNISIRPSVEDKRTAPFWEGAADEVERIDGDRSGSIGFTGAAFVGSDVGNQPPEGYPVELSGTLSWSCGEWLRAGPNATPR